MAELIRVIEMMYSFQKERKLKRMMIPTIQRAMARREGQMDAAGAGLVVVHIKKAQGSSGERRRRQREQASRCARRA